jgi:hypothetical protein
MNQTLLLRIGPVQVINVSVKAYLPWMPFPMPSYHIRLIGYWVEQYSQRFSALATTSRRREAGIVDIYFTS